ncbi:MAG: carbon-nitrogen family hydrolase [Desulfuromonadales bacterium]|nr:carbon-nitrogen family hydrolase [Desulfuromonadales bacterium]
MTQLRCAAIQFNIDLGDIDSNRKQAASALRRVAAAGVQLAVLPEMWSTGYDYRHLPTLAQRTPEIVKEMQQLCAELGLVSVGSLPELSAGKIYNTAYVIDQGKVVGSYRKLHLFSAMGEDRHLSAGNQSLAVDTSVGRIGVAICYDLRFPELFRKLALTGAEIICVPAEWPKPRGEHWQILLRARAIENQLFVAAANCCRIQGKLDFCGLSRIISPLGTILAEAAEEDTELIADCDFNEMVTYREQIKILHDRRADIYGTP